MTESITGFEPPFHLDRRLGIKPLQFMQFQMRIFQMDLSVDDVCGLFLQNRPLSWRPERRHPAGDDQGGAEDSVSRGGGPRLLPVTDGPVHHCCKWEPSTGSDMYILQYLSGLTGFYYAGCQLKDLQRRNHCGPNGLNNCIMLISEDFEQ